MRHLIVLSSRDGDDFISDSLRGADWKLVFARSAAEASALIGQHDIRVGLVFYWPEDIKGPNDDLRGLLSHSDRTRWVGAFPRECVEDRSVARLIAEYLHDYTSLPLDAERLRVVLGHAYGMARIVSGFRKSQARRTAGRHGMVGSSSPMNALFDAIDHAAKSNLPVLIRGEPGSGKETTARAIHSASAFGNGRFVRMGCASLTIPDLRAEMDRFVDGDPAGTAENRGRNDTKSTSGTLFLDEIADLPVETQAKALDVFINHLATREGTGEPARCVPRLVSASSRDLEKLARSDRIRLEFLFRLQVLSIEVPPLRDRREDIPALARHFLNEFQRDRNTRATGFTRDALLAIEQYGWPGNLLELKNCILQAALFSRSALIAPADLRLEPQRPKQKSVSLQEAREKAERQAVSEAITHTKSMTQVANELRISRMTLYRLLQKYSVPRSTG